MKKEKKNSKKRMDRKRERRRGMPAEGDQKKGSIQVPWGTS